MHCIEPYNIPVFCFILQLLKISSYRIAIHVLILIFISYLSKTA